MLGESGMENDLVIQARATLLSGSYKIKLC